MDKHTTTRFNKAPMLTKPRTLFDLSHTHTTTFNNGDFVPIFCEPVYPGETHSLHQTSLTRLKTSLHQTMDNAYVEFAYFFVPLEVVWPNYKLMFGANDSPWTQTTEYVTPNILLNYTEVKPQSLLNHLGLPVGTYGYSGVPSYPIMDLTPLRSVFKVWNDWYRDENWDSVIAFSTGDNDTGISTTYMLNGVAFKPNEQALKVNRFRDVFSTALPAPQKAQESILPIAGLAPLYTGDMYDINTTDGGAPRFGSSDHPTASGPLWVAAEDSGAGTVFGEMYVSEQTDTGTKRAVDSTNLYADLSEASAVTINQLRLAIVSQAIAERDARGGTRVNERIYSTWGVKVPSLEIGRSQFLGGKRVPLNMMEVLQTSETGTTVLGSDAGHSKTMDDSEGFIFSSTQYGWILGFAYTRTDRSYSQGIDRKFANRGKWTYYDPMLDNIGEVGITKKEIYALGLTSSAGLTEGNEVFGYQEAWYHLKERQNRFSGYFQPGITYTMDSYHYGDKYTTMPQLSASWLKEGYENVDRTIAVSTSASYQFEMQVYFDYKASRIARKYSIPNTFGFGF